MRAPGMGWFRVPVFTWVMMATSIIGLTAFPVLTAALCMLGLDRYVGTHFFTAGMGGNYMLYINLFWTWGHPEVYFLVLPAFGLISEIVATFSSKSLFGYPTMIAASMGIAGVGWVVWAHHFFTMGMGPDLIGFFSAATKAFNWLFTMFRGRIVFTTPMLWAITAILLLLLGGITGMMLSASVVDYTVHDSVFVVAHFHCMVLVIGAGIFAAVTYWWPKLFGFKLNETLGQWFFWTFVAGSLLVFIPMFQAGLDGETRRLDYLFDTSLRPLMLLEVAGIGVYFISVFFFLAMVVVSLVKREPAGQDAWGTGRSLEWLTHTPVPFYNFAVTPQVHALDEMSWRKANGLEKTQPSTYVPIHMPSSTSLPFIIGMLSFVCTFSLVWRIWWLAGASLLAAILLVIIRSFDKNEGYVLSAENIAEMERKLHTVSLVAEQSKVLPVGGHAEAH
jgi:cytochrome o ubiquinol oxidase subunit 1